MPYANHQGICIHYQLDGEGPPLVLQHGFTSSLKHWYRYGYVEALRQDYQLILIDARGHGGSDKPHDPAAYDLSLRAGDVVAVLDDLHLPTAYFWGYSMGGRIGFGLAKYAPERLAALIIGGMHPYERRLAAANSARGDRPRRVCCGPVRALGDGSRDAAARATGGIIRERFPGAGRPATG